MGKEEKMQELTSTQTGKLNPNKMTFADAVRAVFSNLLKFKGRARRKEFWTFMLIYLVMSVCAVAMDILIGNQSFYVGFINVGTPIFLSVRLIFLIPQWAVMVRRLHDTGYSAWHVLWPIDWCLGLIWLSFFGLMDSEKEANKYGESPKYGNIENEQWNQ